MKLINQKHKKLNIQKQKYSRTPIKSARLIRATDFQRNEILALGNHSNKLIKLLNQKLKKLDIQITKNNILFLQKVRS